MHIYVNYVYTGFYYFLHVMKSVSSCPILSVPQEKTNKFGPNYERSNVQEKYFDKLISQVNYECLFIYSVHSVYSHIIKNVYIFFE